MYWHVFILRFVQQIRFVYNGLLFQTSIWKTVRVNILYFKTVSFNIVHYLFQLKLSVSNIKNETCNLLVLFFSCKQLYLTWTGLDTYWGNVKSFKTNMWNSPMTCFMHETLRGLHQLQNDKKKKMLELVKCNVVKERLQSDSFFTWASIYLLRNRKCDISYTALRAAKLKLWWPHSFVAVLSW